MHIIERLEMADLATMNRVLRKRGLSIKMVGVDADTITMRVTVLPPPPAKPEAPTLPLADPTVGDTAMLPEDGHVPELQS